AGATREDIGNRAASAAVRLQRREQVAISGPDAGASQNGPLPISTAASTVFRPAWSETRRPWLYAGVSAWVWITCWPLIHSHIASSDPENSVSSLGNLQ